MIRREANVAKLAPLFKGFGPSEAAQGRKHRLRFTRGGKCAIQKHLPSQFLAHDPIFAPEMLQSNQLSPRRLGRAPGRSGALH